jgi:integrase
MPKAKERDGVFQRTDRSGWWVSYVNADGKRKKEKVTAFTRTQAMTALSQIKTRIERDSILGVKSASEITTADLLARFKAYQKAQLRPTTFVRLDGILNTLKAALPTLAKEITRRTVADYILKRSETVSAGTVAKEFATLNHALRLAVEWELLTVNPAQGAKLPRQSEGRTRYLSPTEFKAALEAAPDWMRAPMALAAFTGMRRGEILGLCWKDIDLANQRAYLTETKNGTLRVVALNALAAGVPRRERGPPQRLHAARLRFRGHCRRLFPLAPTHGGKLAGHGRRGPVRGGPDSRTQDAAHDATVRASLTRIHGGGSEQVRRGVCRGAAGAEVKLSGGMDGGSVPLR